MKYITSAIVLTFIFSSSPVFAGGYHHRGFSPPWRGHHHFRPHHRHGYPAAAAIGGLVVGGIIGSAIARAENNSVRYIDNRPLYRNNNAYNPYANGYRPQGNGGYFRRESNGDCFLVNQNDYGNEVYTSVPTRNCQ